MHLILAKLNCRTSTRHLLFSFRIGRFRIWFIYHDISFEVGGDGVPLILLRVLLLLLLFISLLLAVAVLLSLFLLLLLLSHLSFFLDFLLVKAILESYVSSVATTLPLLFLKEEESTKKPASVKILWYIS